MRPLAPALCLLVLAACTDRSEATDTGQSCGTGDVCAIMGTGELGFNGDGLPALETRLASPTSVFEDALGRPGVVDFSNMRLRVLDSDGTVTTIAGDGTHAYTEVGVPATQSPMENPVDAAWGSDGLLYIQPAHESRVVRIEDDGTMGLYAGLGYIGDAGDGDSAATATMGYGAGIAFSPDGDLYISDNTFSRVRLVDPEGVLHNVLGTGVPDQSGEGYGPEVPLHSPERIVVDAVRGRLLVADTLNHSVLAMDLESLEVEVLAGDGLEGTTGDGGEARSARLSQPVGLAVTPEGVVLIAELGSDRIRAVDPSGIIETVVGGSETDTEPVLSAEPLAMPLRGPAGLAWTTDGDLLIAERSGHRLLRWMGASDAL